MSSTDEQANLAAQRTLYGEPLGDIATRIMTELRLTQGRLADALQLSAPMLSQLMSGHRVKIGNPAVVHRLQALAQLAEDAARLTEDQVRDRIAAIRDEHATITGIRTGEMGGRAAAILVLRSTAPPAALLRAAEAAGAPELAGLLREAAETDGRG